MARPRKGKDQRSATLAVYLPPSLLDRLRSIASKDRRSASTQALIYIEQGLDSE